MDSLLVVMFAALVVLTGCVSSDGPALSGAGNPELSVTYQDTNVPQSEAGNGTISGQVRSDAGFPIRGAFVALISTDFSTKTNDTGFFLFANVPPAHYKLRADGPMQYAPREMEIEVLPDKVASVVLTLTPKEGVGSGQLDHAHDYWGDRTEFLAADAYFKYKEYQSRYGSSTYYQTMDLIWPAWTAYDVVIATRCYSPTVVGSREIWFNDPAQTVWAGTSHIEVKFNWGPTDAVNVDGLAIGWRSPLDVGHGSYDGSTMKNFNLSKKLKPNEPFLIPVQPAMWDSGHAPFTQWQFWACTYGSEDQSLASSFHAGGRAFLGKLHVQMKLIRGHAIHAEPPHPEFWSTGDHLWILEQYRNLSCSSSSTSANLCYQAYHGYASSGRQTSAIFTMKPGSTLIPPGTKYLHAILSWTVSGAGAGPHALGLSYQGADLPPRMKNNIDHYKVAEPSERNVNSREYEIHLKPGENDGFYQRQSNWIFLWGNEGKEKDAGYVPPCPCDLKVKLEVFAVRDPTYGGE